jgi:hypothetical protein
MTLPRGAPAGGMSLADFWQRFVLLPNDRGELVTPVAHREQARVVAAIDSGQYRELLLHWAKKSAKSFTAAVSVCHSLVASPGVRSERRIAIASADEDQSRIIFGQARQLIERHPWLSRRVRVLRTEMIYAEHARDPRTGGRYTVEHTVVALPRDLKGTHGEPWSHIVRDEIWSEPDHAYSESLILDPSRPGGQILYCTYHQPRVMAKPGVPLFDLLERAHAGDPSLFYSFIGGEGTDASWRVCTWISESWVSDQKRILAACPAKYRRIILNEPAGADSGLITAEELKAAIDPTLAVEPLAGVPGVRYSMGVDLGVTNDWTALVVLHTDAEARVVVDVVKDWRGTRERPVDLMHVEETIVSLARRFPMASIRADQWNAALLAQRLERRGVAVKLVGVEASRLDRIISLLKTTASRRLLRLSPSHVSLLEQLESVQVVEGRSARRDLVKFAPSGTGLDAGSHDDLVVALGLALEAVSESIGRLAIADMPHGCYLGQLVACYVGGGNGLPEDRVCRACPGNISIKAAYAAHQARGGEAVDLRTYARTFLRPNMAVLDARIRERAQDW